jgi:hypothetical protein
MADDSCFAVLLVHGSGAASHGDALQAHYGVAQSVTQPEELQSGDMLLRDDDTTGLEWIASNVLLLPDMRAPIVRKIALADALAEMAEA